jgi:hypothetical protein
MMPQNEILQVTMAVSESTVLLSFQWTELWFPLPDNLILFLSEKFR